MTLHAQGPDLCLCITDDGRGFETSVSRTRPNRCASPLGYSP
ncbi:MAG: hypothetical protein R3A44_43475 [Caldilineaceae bacterium]